MKNFILFLFFAFLSCAKPQVHPPVGGILSQNDLQVSKNRSRLLNETERLQIEDWIKTQKEPYFAMGLNYWVDKEHFDKNPRRKDDEIVSYEYDIYDFDQVKIYAAPKKNIDASLGHFHEMKAIDDAVRYAKKGEIITLLVPSVLAYGTYGDQDQISNDTPLIIKLKVF